MGSGASNPKIQVKVWPLVSTAIVAPADDGSSTALDNLVVLTWNVGLMRFRLCGKTVFSNPPFVQERALHIAPSILAHEPDIVALQECYEFEHVNMLISALGSRFPFHAHVECNNSLKKDPGLLLFSRFPILRHSVACIPHRESSFGEKAALAANKSLLLATIKLPGHPPMQLINMHTTYTEKTRQGEVDEGMALALKTEEKGHPSLLVGDLNCGPLPDRDGLSPKTLGLGKASDAIYRSMLERGFTDAFRQGLGAKDKMPGEAGAAPGEASAAPGEASAAPGEASAAPGEAKTGPGEVDAGSPESDPGADSAQKILCTWDPANYLNAGGVHDMYPPQRLDHVMCGPLLSSRWRATKAQVVMTDRVVALPGSAMSSPSDHYGVLVTLSARKDICTEIHNTF